MVIASGANAPLKAPARAGILPATVLALLCALPGGAAAQQASLQGIVLSTSTGSPLEGVTITLEAAGQSVRGALTDQNGFYQLGQLRPGTYLLRGRQVGYREYRQPLTLAADERGRVNFQLETEPVPIQGILVETRKPAQGAPIRDLGRQVVTPAEIRVVPVPAGTGDLATYIQTLPGVATTGDRGGQIFVRGGAPAENLVLVDGIPIYQPFHILGFFSVFPEDLVSSADFYAGGFGARYSGRTSSVLDVHMRDGNPERHTGLVSASPFLVEGLAEGPLGGGFTFLASARRSLVEETSGTLLGETQPYGFDSQLLKLTASNREDQRCSALLLRTSDRGRLDPVDQVSHVAWQNLLLGGRCVTQFTGFVRLAEVSFTYTGFENDAISRGASMFNSNVRKVENAAHLTTMIGAVPLSAGYHLSGEFTSLDLSELFGISWGDDGIFSMDLYAETSLALAGRVEARPGVVLTLAPVAGVEPRLRASWAPFGNSNAKLQGLFGIYRQNLVGVSDIRDVTSTFTAWMGAPEDVPLEVMQGALSWQQSLANGLRFSLDGYYKRMEAIPVPVWRATAAFATQLTRADGKSYGGDTRIEYTTPNFYGFIGYGYSWTTYESSQREFASWYGTPVQSYHPPHDRRHQLNAVASLDLAKFHASARWQFGSGLPFTRPLGFDQAFNYTIDLYNVSKLYGTARVLMDRPFNGRLPDVHRLDVSLQRSFDIPVGKLQVQAGVINAYDRQNMFFYDLYTGRRVDQLPLAPYAALTLRGNRGGRP